ncbi:hypothetical protein ACNKHT_00075 [Shigella flexneri]
MLENAEGDRTTPFIIAYTQDGESWSVSRLTSGSDEPAKHPVCD